MSQASKRPKPQNVPTLKRPNSKTPQSPLCGDNSFQLKISIIHAQMADFLENKSERPKATVLQKASRKKFPKKYSKTKIIRNNQ
jgi:hypothetical protein